MQPLGQHFLISQAVLARIIEAAELTPTDTVLEIGPGRGVLTRALAERVKQVIAVEKDRQLAEALKKEFALMPAVEIITADIRDILEPPNSYFLPPSLTLRRTAPKLSVLSRIPNSSYKVVANIPYYLTSHLIRLLLERQPQPQLIVLMVQREVAERIAAQPPQMNLLALSVQIHGISEIIALVPQSAFYPQPKVESAIIRIRPRPQPLIGGSEIESLFRIARIGFGQKRKTLLNNLVQGLELPKDRVLEALKSAALDPLRRAQTLTLEEWQLLTKMLDI